MAFDFTKPITHNTKLKAHWECPEPLLILTQTAGGGGEIKLYNKWTVAVEIEGLRADPGQYVILPTKANDVGRTITFWPLTENVGTVHRFSSTVRNAVVECDKSSNVRFTADVPYMPNFMPDENTILDYSFYYMFYTNYNGTVMCPVDRLAEGNFDMSAVTTAGGYAFYNFVNGSPITEIPEGSFSFENLRSVTGAEFMNGAFWMLDSISFPDGAFNFSNLMNVSGMFLMNLMAYSTVKRFPAGSFSFDSLASTSRAFMSNTFQFAKFECDIPDGCFRFPQLVSIDDTSFGRTFGATTLTSLPAGSFNFDLVTYIGRSVFSGMFASCKGIQHLPEGSFRFPKVNSIGDTFCSNFHGAGSLTGLPYGSFQFPSYTSSTQPADFMKEFNYSYPNSGALTEGNRGVAIKALGEIVDPRIGQYVNKNVPVGEYLYVNADYMP